MCGLVGFINNNGHASGQKRRAFLEQGLVIDILRGEDSTGVFFGGKNASKAGYCKQPVDGLSFVNGAPWTKSSKGLSGWNFAVGHNRAATIGNISTEAAHPFMEGPITCVHNGTVRGNMDLLPITFKKANVPVDSWALTKNLAAVEPDEVGERILRNIPGAYALIWYDTRDKTLNFARNNTRPLHFMQSYEDKTLYFASEPGQLQWLNQRLKLGGADVLYLEAGKHLKFKTTDLTPKVLDFALSPKTASTQKPARGKGKQRSGTGTGHSSKGLRQMGYVPGKQPGVWVKKETRTPPADRVMLGGKLREIPALTKRHLAAVNLSADCRLLFTPVAAQPKKFAMNKTSRRYVQGFLDSVNMNAIIYSVDSHVVENGINRRWMVRPVAVKYVDTAREQPLVVCEMVASVPDKEKLLSKKAKDVIIAEKPSPDASTEGAAISSGVVGPTGDFITKDEWMELTEDGCWACEKPIQIEDARKINWQTDRNALYPKPLCPECVAEDEAALEELMARNGYIPFTEH